MTYVFSTASGANREEIEELLLTYYLVDETLNAAAGIRDIDFLRPMKEIVARCLETPFSFVARHSETNELAGVILNSLWRRGEDEDYYSTTTRNDPVATAHDAVVNDIHGSFWKLVDAGVSLALHQEMSSVAIAHRRTGIASRLLKLSMNRKELTAAGIQGIVVEASSEANQKLLDKHGFHTLNSIDYADYTDELGNALLVPKDGSSRILLKWKPVKELIDGDRQG